MRPEAKKKGGMMFGGKKRGMPAALNKGKTNHGKMAFFAEGGDIGDEEIKFARADMDRESDIKESARAVPKMEGSFKEEFAKARAKGDANFKFNGKLYNTKVAPPSKPKPKDTSVQVGGLSSVKDLNGRRETKLSRAADKAVPKIEPDMTGYGNRGGAGPMSRKFKGWTGSVSDEAIATRKKEDKAKDAIVSSRGMASVANLTGGRKPSAIGKATDKTLPTMEPDMTGYGNRGGSGPPTRRKFKDFTGSVSDEAIAKSKAPVSAGAFSSVRDLRPSREMSEDSYQRRNPALSKALERAMPEFMPKMAEGGSVGKYSKMEMEHVAQMKKHGVPKKFVKQEQKEAMGMKKGGMACGGKMKYAAGGTIAKPYKPTAGDLNEKFGGDQEMENREYMRKKAAPKPAAPKPKMYAKGGMVRGDGCATRGKTKGRFV